jgi:hypothetical protein
MFVSVTYPQQQPSSNINRHPTAPSQTSATQTTSIQAPVPQTPAALALVAQTQVAQTPVRRSTRRIRSSIRNRLID